MAEDRMLSELGQFTGTEEYHKMSLFKSQFTDGVAYIMQNGYQWLVTDALAVIETELRDEEFLAVKLKVAGKAADMAIDDGNGKILYKKHYTYTDAKRDVTLFWENGVLLLSGEH